MRKLVSTRVPINWKEAIIGHRQQWENTLHTVSFKKKKLNNLNEKIYCLTHNNTIY